MGRGEGEKDGMLGREVWVDVKHVVYKIQDGEVKKKEKNIIRKKKEEKRCCHGNQEPAGVREYSAHNWRITKIIEIKNPSYMHTNLCNKNVNELAVNTSPEGSRPCLSYSFSHIF